ncbi:positive regulation of interleukin-13 biosynthetic process [Porites harrisoni]
MLSKSQVSSLEQDRSFVRGVAKQRQRFTPWLEQQIESGDIDGLEWIDKDIGIFKVPWARVDKPEFELETHAELFKRWASHTGKYRPGDQPDPSTWKKEILLQSAASLVGQLGEEGLHPSQASL